MSPCLYLLLIISSHSVALDMPRILSHTPAWLSEAASRFKLFSENAATNHAENRNAELGKHGKTSSSCPRRVIASRGSEVFVATGKTIKWADLASWKSAWESKAAPRYQNGKRQTSVEPDDESQDGPSYKVRSPICVTALPLKRVGPETTIRPRAHSTTYTFAG